MSASIRDASAGLVQGLYYLALGTWLGATVMMGMAAGTTFAVTRRMEPKLDSGPAALPDVAPYASEYFAGQIVNVVFGWHTGVLAVCVVLLVLACLLQFTVFRDRLAGRGRSWANLARAALIGVAVALFAADLLFTRQPMRDLRTTMYDEQATAAERASAREAFAGLHEWSSRAMGVTALLAAAAAVVSPFAFTSGPIASRED